MSVFRGNNAPPGIVPVRASIVSGRSVTAALFGQEPIKLVCASADLQIYNCPMHRLDDPRNFFYKNIAQ